MIAQWHEGPTGGLGFGATNFKYNQLTGLCVFLQPFSAAWVQAHCVYPIVWSCQESRKNQDKGKEVKGIFKAMFRNLQILIDLQPLSISFLGLT